MTHTFVLDESEYPNACSSIITVSIVLKKMHNCRKIKSHKSIQSPVLFEVEFLLISSTYWVFLT